MTDAKPGDRVTFVDGGLTWTATVVHTHDESAVLRVDPHPRTRVEWVLRDHCIRPLSALSNKESDS